MVCGLLRDMKCCNFERSVNVRRQETEREKELAKVYEPYGYYEGIHYRIREDAPQEAKDAYEEARRIAWKICLET